MGKCKIHQVALGLSLGVVWGISLMLMGAIAHYFMYGRAFVAAVAQLYPGYDSSILGILLGGFSGFVDAFIGGFLTAWLYNVFSGCCKKDDK